VTDIPHEQKSDIILRCEREMVDFRLVPDLFEVLTSNVAVVGIDGVPLMGLRPLPLDSAWNRFLKRVFDVAGSLIGLVLAAPIIAVASVFIKGGSRGPVFYRQVRCGEDGKEFVLYKLRTMKVDAERQTGPVMALEDDPRKTPIGRFLRKYNLDELPQLYNVIKGDMSLVGPRPERPYFIEQFKYSIPRYMSRHHIKCGITGWAQVHGLIQATPLEERIKYDIYYMENWSLLLDLRIILMTVLTTKDGY
jgi:exopolysaccharide biosynthesis polyprenyl glycosylphosphotransferase